MERILEEVAAGRLDVLQDLDAGQLAKVLDRVNKKRKRDHDYIREEGKRLKLSQMPHPPVLVGRETFVEHGAQLGDVLNELGLVPASIEAGLRV